MGIAVWRRELQYWQAACVRGLVATGFARLALVVEIDGPPPRLPGGRRAGAPAALDAGFATLTLKSPPGRSPAIAEAQRRAVAGHTLDLLLDLTGLRLGRELAPTARLGVWAFHHGDPERYDGAAPGLAEVANGDHASCAILYRDAGGEEVEVLREGWFKTRQTPGRNADSLLLRGARFPALVVAAMADTRAPPPVLRRVRLKSPGTRAGRLGRRGQAAMRLCAYLAGSLSRRLRRERWSIGIVEQPLAEIIRARRLGQVKWVEGQPEDRFYADPFPLRRRDGRLDVLIEASRYARPRGYLAKVAIDVSGRVGDERVILDTPHHLSYPFLLADEGTYYVLPESWEADRLSAYRLEPADGVLLPEHELIVGQAIVDPTLLHRDGQWWLFCCDRHDDDNTNLYIFHARHWRGPWLPHAMNPVKSDIRSSRPAGAFVEVDGALYRPAQDCALRYGSAIAFNRVVELDQRRFREEVAFVLKPDPAGPYPDGLHTINGLGDVTVIDGQRWSFEPWAAIGDKFARRRARARRQ